MNHMPIVIRDEYLVITDGDACAAAILNAFEMWSEGEAVWIRRTQPQLKDDLMGLFGTSRIGTALKNLTQKGYITVAGNLGFGITNEYQINLAFIDTELVKRGLERSIVPLEEELDIDFVSPAPAQIVKRPPPAKHQKAGCVYLIKANNGLYKIGITENVEKRYNNLKTMSPAAIELIHSFAVADTRGTEKQLHARFANHRQHGEWFALSVDEVEYIKGLTS